MGFRFFRRITLAPGVTLNLSKSGGSLSFGRRGAKFTVGPRGQRATVGIPGTGIFYTTTFGTGQAKTGSRTSRTVPAPVVRQADRLTMGFFKRLITPDDEEALVDGWRELLLGNETAALQYLRSAAHLADGAFLAGALALKQGSLEEATTYLTTAAGKEKELGQIFSKYDVATTISLVITEEVSAHVGADLRGVLLALAETYQGQGRGQEAISCLKQLRQLEPDDIVIKVSLAELLIEAEPGKQEVYQTVVQLAEGVENESPIHTALLLYKIKALRGLGLLEAALAILPAVLRRTKDRPRDLLHALRYEHALLYDAMNQNQRARAELEKLYADAPDYEDVAVRLGIREKIAEEMP